MSAIQSQVRYSIEQCIRDHLDQESDRDQAIRCASEEIVQILMAPIGEHLANPTEKQFDGEPCDECGRTIPDTAEEMANHFHSSTCSLFVAKVGGTGSPRADRVN